MTEKIEDTIRKGYRTWRKNLVIGVAPALSIIFPALLLLIIGIILYFSRDSILAYMGLDIYWINWSLVNWLNVLLIVAAFSAALYLIALLILSYFTAGAIGMAKTALEMGKTSLGDMFSYGGKKFMSVFFAMVIVSIIAILGAVIAILPTVLLYYLNILNATAAFAVLGATLWVAFIIVLIIVVVPVPYAIVVSDLGALDGLGRGYKFFMENKLISLFLVFAVMGAGWLFGLVASIILFIFPLTINIIDMISPVSGISLFLTILYSILQMVLNAFVVAAIATFWWTRLYMDRTGMKLKEIPTESYPKETEPVSEKPIPEPIYM
jgi:hypothetical protein